MLEDTDLFLPHVNCVTLGKSSYFYGSYSLSWEDRAHHFCPVNHMDGKRNYCRCMKRVWR